MHAHNHHSHHHRRRKRAQNGHNNHNGNAAARITNGERKPNGHHKAHSSACNARRHHSVTDVSNTSLNCNDASCNADREIQEILVKKSLTCCTTSRTELAQYFAEDLYGTSARRPSSCCTSSDYCYQTDSTSLYGSRSSLSRNNSVKSASVTLRKKKVSSRQPNQNSVSLRALNASRPNSQMGSLASIFDRAKRYAEDGTKLDSTSKSSLERHGSRDALSNDLPEYACSPSPIRWSFLADGKSPTDTLEDKRNGEATKSNEDIAAKQQESSHKHMERANSKERQDKERGKHATARPQQQLPMHQHEHHAQHHHKTATPAAASIDERPSTSRKCCESPFKYEHSTMVHFQQDADPFNNCCNNYIQCNTYLDQDLQITSEDIHQYLSKGQQEAGSILNNTKTYPFQPSNALEFQYKNNFANNNNTASNTLSSVEGTESMRSYDSRFRRNSSKETNLNQNGSMLETCSGGAACTAATCGGGGGVAAAAAMSPTNINLSSSTNNINIVFSTGMERNANEVKFINTGARGGSTSSATTTTAVVSTEAHHSGYLPYTYPSYDYSNMSSNSVFDKPLGINEISKECNKVSCANAMCEEQAATTSSSQHSSSLHSPEPQGVSFESFDASSGHNLLSKRGSCQYSPTPRSPLSVCSSNCSASVNPSSTSYVQMPHHSHYDYPPGAHAHGSPTQDGHYKRQQHSHHSHYNNSQQHQQQQQEQHYHYHFGHDENNGHMGESFRLTNALKKVRRRARKYTGFLRKK